VRVRSLTAAAVASLALAGLAGCRSNVGDAAVVNGARISDTTVSHYVTPSAKSITLQSSSGAGVEVGPKAFVLQTVVYTRLLKALVKAGPGGGPTKAQLASLSRQTRAGKSATAYAKSQGITGYTSAFDRLLVQRQTYAAALQTYQQQGVDLPTLLKKAKIKVSVSPRYGKWDSKALSLDGSSGAGVPGFVKLQPTPNGSASASPIAVPTQ
jgi:hypothetical protein